MLFFFLCNSYFFFVPFVLCIVPIAIFFCALFTCVCNSYCAWCGFSVLCACVCLISILFDAVSSRFADLNRFYCVQLAFSLFFGFLLIDIAFWWLFLLVSWSSIVFIVFQLTLAFFWLFANWHCLWWLFFPFRGFQSSLLCSVSI